MGRQTGRCAVRAPGNFQKSSTGLTMRIGMETKTPTVLDTKPVGPSMPSSSLSLSPCSVAISIYSLLTLYEDLFLSLLFSSQRVAPEIARNGRGAYRLTRRVTPGSSPHPIYFPSTYFLDAAVESSGHTSHFFFFFFDANK